MPQNIKSLYGHHLDPADGAVGQVKDLYFDDRSWPVRYLVADTGTWLPGRQVPLSHRAPVRRAPTSGTLAVTGYRLQAIDGPIGHVGGFLVEDKTWHIWECAVATGHWYASKEIRVSTAHICRLNADERKVYVDPALADLARTAAQAVVVPAPVV